MLFKKCEYINKKNYMFIDKIYYFLNKINKNFYIKCNLIYLWIYNSKIVKLFVSGNWRCL